MCPTIQVQVCGTRDLNDDEFKRVEDTLTTFFKGTDCEGAEVTRAHYDWSVIAAPVKANASQRLFKLSGAPYSLPAKGKTAYPPKFQGHINVDIIGSSTADWKRKTNWNEPDTNLQSAVAKALIGTELEGTRIQSNVRARTNSRYEASQPLEKGMPYIDRYDFNKYSI